MSDDLKLVLTLFSIGAVIGATICYVFFTKALDFPPVYTVTAGFVVGGIAPFTSEGV